MILQSKKLNRRIRIERPQVSEDFEGAGEGNWTLVAELWAEVEDMLPSRGEKLADGMNIATRPARVRVRHREGIEASMRCLIGRLRRNEAGQRVWETQRVAQIVTTPAEIGDRSGLEFMIEDYSTAGSGA